MRRRLLLAAVFSMSSLSSAGQIKRMDDRKSQVPGCLQKWVFTKTESVLEEQRRRGPPLSDFPETFKAAKIDVKTFNAVEAARSFQLDGAPILWLTPDRAAVVVDERAFSTLEAVDATLLRPGDRKTLGRRMEGARGKLDGRSLAEFLLRAGVIRTFAHLESEICLMAEEKGKSYRGDFLGTHTYYTNARHEARVSFALTVAEDGTIAVAGRK